jgi:hypothetical protein
VRADRRREVSAVVTAFVTHVLFLTLAPRTPLVENEPPPAVIDVAADTTIEIDSTNSESIPSAPMAANRVSPETTSALVPLAPERAEMATRTPTEAPQPRAPSVPVPDEDPTAESDQEKPAPDPPPADVVPPEPGPEKPSPPSPPSPAPDEYGSLPPVDSAPGVPGLSGPLWSVPGALPSTAAPKPAATTITAAPAVPSDVASRVLSGTLHSRDKAVGIDVPAAGVVASTVADAMRHSALTDTKGTFEIKLSAEGNVESVRFVGSTDGNATQWAGVADAARRSLAGRALQMGPDKQGVTVVVKVESKVKYPAGTKERVDIKPVCANEVIEQMAAAIEGAMQPGGVVRGVRDDKGGFIPYNELDDERRSRFCIPIGIRAVIDPANIGAHMTNSVRSSFQVKRSGEQALPADAALPIDRGAPWMPVAEGKTRPPPPPPKKKWKKKPRRGSIVPVQLN